jgi:hypothetical protein
LESIYLEFRHRVEEIKDEPRDLIVADAVHPQRLPRGRRMGEKNKTKRDKHGQQFAAKLGAIFTARLPSRKIAKNAPQSGF